MSNKGFKVDKHIQLRPQDSSPVDTAAGDLWFDGANLKLNNGTDISSVALDKTVEVELVNNQSTPADVEEMSVSTEYTGFNIDYTCTRIVPGGEDAGYYTDTNGGASAIIAHNGGDIQSTGKLVVPGNFTTFGGVARNYIVRLNSDGTEDTSFYSNLGTGPNSFLRVARVMPDDRILIGGNFTTINGNSATRFARLSADGVHDTTFSSNIGGFFGSQVYSIGFLSTGLLIVGGEGAPRLTARNSDGTAATSFNTNLGTGFNSDVTGILVSPDDKIYVRGLFTTFNGNTRSHLVKLNSDGTEDTAFYTNLGTGFNNSINSIEELSGGRIMVCGFFTSLNGNSSYKRFVVLNADGTVDTSFVTNMGSSFSSGSAVHAKELLDGRIVIVHTAANYNGQVRNGLVFLNPDGTEDTATYESIVGTGGSGFGFVSGAHIYQDQSGLVIITGDFTSFNSNTRNRIIAFDIDGNEYTRCGSFKGLYRSLSDAWEIGGGSYIGDDVGVTFSITNDGQVQYTSTDLNAITNTLKFKMTKI